MYKIFLISILIFIPLTAFSEESEICSSFIDTNGDSIPEKIPSTHRDFSYCNLIGFQLSNRNLSNASFVGADISGSYFFGSNLQNVNFENSTSYGTNFQSTN